MAVPIHTRSEHNQSTKERLKDYLNKPTSSDPFFPQNPSNARLGGLMYEVDRMLSQFESPSPDWETKRQFRNVGTTNAIESRTAEPWNIAGIGVRDLQQTSPWDSSTTPAWTPSSTQVGPAYSSKCPDTRSAKDEAPTAIIVDPKEDIFSEIRLLVFQFYYLCSVGIESRTTENEGDKAASSSSAGNADSQNTPSGSSKRKRTEKGIHEQVHEERHDDDHNENRRATKRSSGPERDLRRDFGCWFFKWAPYRYQQCIEFHGKEIHAFRRVMKLLTECKHHLEKHLAQGDLERENITRETFSQARHARCTPSAKDPQERAEETWRLTYMVLFSHHNRSTVPSPYWLESDSIGGAWEARAAQIISHLEQGPILGMRDLVESFVARAQPLFQAQVRLRELQSEIHREYDEMFTRFHAQVGSLVDLPPQVGLDRRTQETGIDHARRLRGLVAEFELQLQRDILQTVPQPHGIGGTATISPGANWPSIHVTGSDVGSLTTTTPGDRTYQPNPGAATAGNNTGLGEDLGWRFEPTESSQSRSSARDSSQPFTTRDRSSVTTAPSLEAPSTTPALILPPRASGPEGSSGQITFDQPAIRDLSPELLPSLDICNKKTSVCFCNECWITSSAELLDG